MGCCGHTRRPARRSSMPCIKSDYESSKQLTNCPYDDQVVYENPITLEYMEKKAKSSQLLNDLWKLVEPRAGTDKNDRQVTRIF